MRWFHTLWIFLFTVALTTSVQATLAQQTPLMELAESGPYDVGYTTITFVDQSRDNRELVTEIWYPALIPDSEEIPETGLRDAEPDFSAAPYPLILYSQGASFSKTRTGVWLFLKTHLASHGFIIADASPMEDILPTTYTHRPFDILFLIEELGTLSNNQLEAIVNNQQVGIAGWGIGANIALMVGGARIDPNYVDTYCNNPPPETPYSLCNFAYPDEWFEFIDYREQLEPIPENDTLWSPVTDTRIKAIFSAQTPWPQVFGENGLETATLPTLFLGCVQDSQLVYDDVVFAYDYLGSQDKYLLSLLKAGHIWADQSAITFRPEITHFATAFFAYYLQSQENYSQYLSSEYVEQFEDLAWGVYQKD